MSLNVFLFLQASRSHSLYHVGISWYERDFFRLRRKLLLVYRELRDEDLYLKNVVQPHALGDGSKTESWLWSFGAAASLSTVERTEFENECE